MCLVLSIPLSDIFIMLLLLLGLQRQKWTLIFYRNHAWLKSTFRCVCPVSCFQSHNLLILTTTSD